MLTRKDLPKLHGKVEAMHFGSISLIPEPGGSTLEAFLRREARSRVICLDPNIRPGMIKNRRAHLSRLNRMISMADIVKISDEDVTWMTGKDDFGRAARKWLKAGASVVVVTRGSAGVEAYTARDEIIMPAVKVRVADTVGAGDTFTAGLLTALRKARRLDKTKLAAISRTELENCLAFAARAAAVTCSRPGADPPWAKELA